MRKRRRNFPSFDCFRTHEKHSNPSKLSTSPSISITSTPLNDISPTACTQALDKLLHLSETCTSKTVTMFLLFANGGIEAMLRILLYWDLQEKARNSPSDPEFTIIEKAYRVLFNLLVLFPCGRICLCQYRMNAQFDGIQFILRSMAFGSPKITYIALCILEFILTDLSNEICLESIEATSTLSVLYYLLKEKAPIQIKEKVLELLSQYCSTQLQFKQAATQLNGVEILLTLLRTFMQQEEELTIEKTSPALFAIDTSSKLPLSYTQSIEYILEILENLTKGTYPNVLKARNTVYVQGYSSLEHWSKLSDYYEIIQRIYHNLKIIPNRSSTPSELIEQVTEGIKTSRLESAERVTKRSNGDSKRSNSESKRSNSDSYVMNSPMPTSETPPNRKGRRFKVSTIRPLRTTEQYPMVTSARISAIHADGCNVNVRFSFSSPEQPRIQEETTTSINLLGKEEPSLKHQLKKKPGPKVSDGRLKR